MSSAGIRCPWTAAEQRLLASGEAIVEVKYSGDGLTRTERVVLCSTFPPVQDKVTLPRSPQGVKISKSLARKMGVLRPVPKI